MVQVKRRCFLVSASALLAVPFAPAGQQARHLWRIGVLRPAPDDAVFRKNFAPFPQALSEFRFTEGTNLTFEYRVRPGKLEDMLGLANDLVRAKVDAILAVAPAGVRAAARATTSIPIVAVDLESDPIADGFAANLARPGGNITGLFLDFPDLSGKWLQLLKEVVPTLVRAAVLWDPATGPNLLNGAEAAGSSMGVQLLRVEARSAGDLDQAFDLAVKQEAEAILTLSSPVFNSARKQIAALAARHRMPTLVPFPGFADDGGLIAHGPHLTSLFRQAGSVMAKVLQGTRPGEIPIERPARFELVVNLKTARALGIAIPRATLLQADRVIE